MATYVAMHCINVYCVNKQKYFRYIFNDMYFLWKSNIKVELRCHNMNSLGNKLIILQCKVTILYPTG